MFDKSIMQTLAILHVARNTIEHVERGRSFLQQQKRCSARSGSCHATITTTKGCDCIACLGVHRTSRSALSRAFWTFFGGVQECHVSPPISYFGQLSALLQLPPTLRCASGWRYGCTNVLAFERKCAEESAPILPRESQACERLPRKRRCRRCSCTSASPARSRVLLS